MAKPYSEDLRARVVGTGQDGATIPETAEQLGVSISSVVRFRRLHRETGSVSPAKFGGYKGYALAAHEELVRQLVAEQPDITLAELKVLLAKEKVTVGQSSISRFLHHLNLRFKKSLRAAEQDRPDVAAGRKALQKQQPRLDLKRLIFIDETSVSTTITRLYGRAPQGERLAGMTDYVAIITRFAAAGVIGEMDSVYTAWGTRAADGFNDHHIAVLQRIAPYLALAIKSVALARMTNTLMETYLGRDAGQRVLSGRIVRGIAERIDAVVWFSDLRGFTRIVDTAPEQVIPLLNDYSDVIVSAIHEHGGDVLKLIGDGTLAIFTAENRTHACKAALSAAIAARRGVTELKKRRTAEDKPITDMYLGLHVGKVFYGNVGSLERLDFTVLGPAVNEASRIAAMCRLVDQPVLMSAAFADVGDIKRRLVSVGRYALRGVSHPQELFAIDPDS